MFLKCVEGMVFVESLVWLVGRIENLADRCGGEVNQDFIDCLAVSMREHGASEVFISTLHEIMSNRGQSTATDTARTQN